MKIAEAIFNLFQVRSFGKIGEVMKIKAKCLGGHEFTADKKIVNAAKRDGVLTCPKCGDIALIEEVDGVAVEDMKKGSKRAGSSKR